MGPFIDSNGQMGLMVLKIVVALVVVSLVVVVWLRLYRATRRQGVPEVYRLQLDTLTVPAVAGSGSRMIRVPRMAVYRPVLAGASGLPDVLGTAGKTAEPDRNARVM